MTNFNMNKDRQIEVFNDIMVKSSAILSSKGEDYATQDVLSNFKLAGNITGISAELNCLNLIATKVARLGVLLNNKNEPNNESIEDSCIDGLNYFILLIMLLKDKENE